MALPSSQASNFVEWQCVSDASEQRFLLRHQNVRLFYSCPKYLFQSEGKRGATNMKMILYFQTNETHFRAHNNGNI